MVAGLLLTGGASRRMGVDKAELVVGGERLADRNARVLRSVCAPVLEVGGGYSALPAVRERPRGSGPLSAFVTGARALRHRGHHGPVVLLAVDLPFVDGKLLRWLADRAENRATVPVCGGEPQPCCACYGPDAVRAAARLVEAGERSLRALLDATPVELVPEREWRAIAPPDALADVDTPEDLARVGLDPPG